MTVGPLVVVGDALLDRDVTGRADRLSPDAPVPVVSDLSEVDRPGGAGLAALLAARDGADVTLVTALAAAVRKLLAEPFWREAYGTAGVDRARSRYSWDRIAAGTLAVYEDVLGRGGAPVQAEDEDELETAAGSPA